MLRCTIIFRDFGKIGHFSMATTGAAIMAFSGGSSLAGAKKRLKEKEEATCGELRGFS